jgi:hypothetical protein
MTLLIQKPTGAKLNLRKTWQPMDPDAAAYITAVETADGQALEEKTKIAIDNFVLGCKADGIWSAIKASCILAGARTLTGALVPLMGAAPTNVGGLFVSGDYNRKTGLVGDGTTKILDSGRNNNADPQDNKHASLYVSTAQTSGLGAYLGFGTTTIGDTNIGVTVAGASLFSRINTTQGTNIVNAHTATLFLGMSRTSSSLFSVRVLTSTQIFSGVASNAPSNGNILVFSRGSLAAPAAYSNARIAFYSIGESLDLALLDARVTDLINAFAAAIP